MKFLHLCSVFEFFLLSLKKIIFSSSVLLIKKKRIDVVLPEKWALHLCCCTISNTVRCWILSVLYYLVGCKCGQNISSPKNETDMNSLLHNHWYWHTVILKCPLFLVPFPYEVNLTKFACKSVPIRKPKPIPIVFLWLREGQLWTTFVHAQGPELFVSKPGWHATSVVVK